MRPRSPAASGPLVRGLRRLLAALGRNPLVRGWDRLEAALLLAALVVAALAMPIAVGVGTMTYAGEAHSASAERTVRHQVIATVRPSPPAPVVPGQVTSVLGRGSAKATWTADGRRHTGVITLPGAVTGGKVRIWVDAAGRQTLPPPTPGEATSTAVVAAVFTGSCLLVLVVGLYVIARLLLEHRRARAWDLEWERLAGS